MGSKVLVEQLEAAFRELANQSAKRFYDGPADEVAADLTSSDSAIAGIAYTVLSGKRPPPEHITILRKPIFPTDEDTWKTISGEVVRLSDYPELLHYAAVIDRVRRVTLELLSDPDFKPKRRVRPMTMDRVLRGDLEM